MKPEPFTDALVRLVHCYYPSGLRNDDPGYRESEESQRLTRLICVQPSPTWKGFTQQVAQEFPDSSLWDTSVPYDDPCNSLRVSLPGFVEDAPRYDCVVALLSQLAPVYALYASHTHKLATRVDSWLCFPPFPHEFQAHETKLARLIESTLGFTRLSNDVLLTPVPDLVPRTANYGLGEALLVDCLFTRDRW
ncbi:MAG TPA: hypothetical protein VEU33_32210 [Archangium sp.]|nr:hypothetical protein [Archangium sp.]